MDDIGAEKGTGKSCNYKICPIKFSIYRKVSAQKQITKKIYDSG
jgi:hypothetical protein